MNLKDVNIEKISELISVYKRYLTCVECCKCYKIPSTACICTHSLCHSCWCRRSVCPSCGHKIDGKTLMLTLPLQRRLENVEKIITLFKDIFYIKCDSTINLVVENGSNKNVNIRKQVSDIENQVSLSKHQASFTETNPTLHSTPIVKQIASKIQIDSETKNVKKIKNIVHVTAQQDDWDKIEQLTEIETNCNIPKKFGVKNNENFLPSSNNIDNEKTIDENPVKKNSTKTTKTNFKKIAKNWNDSNKINNEFNRLAKVYRNKNISINKYYNPRIRTLFELNDDISRNKNEEFNSQFKKPVETEIRDVNGSEFPLAPVNIVHKLIASSKELTKANNTNKNSLEMEIGDENYSEITSKPAVINNEKLITPSKELTKANNTNKNSIEMEKGDENINNQSSKDLTKVNNTNENIFTSQISEKESLISIKPDNNQLNSKQIRKHVKQRNVSFFQKGPLNNKNSTIVKTTENDSIQNNVTKISSSDNDEIEITMKTGTTLTNICIKKKENDIEVKINSDKQIQTCLNNINVENKTTSCTLGVHNNIFNMNNNFVHNNDDNLKHNNSKISAVNEKSTPSKKGTASADTISIQNEITESIQGELLNSQNHPFGVHHQTAPQSLNTPKANEVFIKNNTQTSPLINKPNETTLRAITQMPPNSVEVESINIFNSEPVEETHTRVQSLKGTKSQLDMDTLVASQSLNNPTRASDAQLNNHTQHTSKILSNIAYSIAFDSEPIEKTNIQSLRSRKKTPSAMSTLKSNTSQFHGVKRNTDSMDLEDFPTNKKRKLQNEYEHSHLESNSQVRLKNKTMNDMTVVETESESLNHKMSSRLLDNENEKNKTPHTVITEKSKINLYNNKMDTINDKCSENIFSLSKEGPDSDVLVKPYQNFQTYNENIKSQSNKRNVELEITKKLNKPDEDDHQLSPVNDLEVISISTVYDDDSDKSVVEDTPQKPQSFTINNKKPIHIQSTQELTTTGSRNINTKDGYNNINLTDTVEEYTMRNDNVTVVKRNKQTLDTPLTITQFAGEITHKSTPVAKKSLNFSHFKDLKIDSETTPEPSPFVAIKSTQEKEFLWKAFDTTLCSQSLMSKRVKFYVAGSCLSDREHAKLKLVCSQRHWSYVEKYTKELTHLVIGVDEEKKSPRSLKYMSALAGAKWIISFDWVEKCLQTQSTVDEEPFEVLDSTGEPGPRRSRLSKRKIFDGIRFFCMPPFTVLDIETLKDILRTAGGRVVEELEDICVKDARPALLLAEPDSTQQDKFIYLAMKLDVVPVNYEWVLNCLGSYTLESIHELLLCSSTLLPKAIEDWPSDLISLDCI